MRGTNPIRTPINDGGETLEIQSIFPTLQGEGPNTGTPAVFVRLGGCNLACSFCDTEFESFAPLHIDSILSSIKELALNHDGERIRHLVVITGGEPMRQPIELLCRKLMKEGFKIQIETNGTIFRELPDKVEIICSPKNTGTGYYPVRQDLLRCVSAMKFIISHSNPLYKTVPEVGQSALDIPVYIQPMDEQDVMKNANNVAYTVKLAMQYGYKLSLQTHKIVGIE